MKVVDANVLLYAVDRQSPQHHVAKGWIDQALSGSESVVLPWLSLLAFVRISTHPSIYDHPLTVDQACDVVDQWLHAPAATSVEPREGHLERLRSALGQTGRGGNLVNDAHLAALALENRATVVTFDSDFGRFAGLRWEIPGS